MSEQFYDNFMSHNMKELPFFQWENSARRKGNFLKMLHSLYYKKF